MSVQYREATKEIPAIIPCPVCRAPSHAKAEAPGYGTWQVCQDCTLQFLHPLRLPRAPSELFQDAYLGKEQQSAMEDFAQRVQQRQALLKNPSLWFWTPAFPETIAWLKQRVGTGATVLELGCGLGFLLHALRQEGFHPVGLDVAELVVELNQQDGFQVWKGPLETLPPGWVQPAAVVCFFMLHHLEDPLHFLQTIRTQWPQAPLVIAQYGPDNKDPRSSSAPRNLTRWNSQSLAEALSTAGYRATVLEIPSTAMDISVLRPFRAALYERLIALPVLYRLAKWLAARILVRRAKPFHRDAFVLLAFAEPNG